MRLQSSTYFRFIIFSSVIINFYSCSKKPQEIPTEFKSYLAHVSIPVEYKGIIPAYDQERLPVPEFITNYQALEDIQMLEYLFSTSYSGYDYWKYKGVDFESFFAGIRTLIHSQDTVYCAAFEQELSKILKKLQDGHISLVGTAYHHAYKHKSVYFCDIVVEKTANNLFKVIDSQFDMVVKGDLFTQENAEFYLFKTLSPPGKHHYLVGVLSFEPITLRKLSFNSKIIRVPFHGSRLRYAHFSDPEPFYIERVNNIPIVRVTGFADKLYPHMKKFMHSAKELKNESVIIVNLFYNGGGSSVFPQGFIRNLNGSIQWETQWATLTSPAITEYFAKYDLNAMEVMSPAYKQLIVSNKKLFDDYRRSPVKTWEFAATHNQIRAGGYQGKLMLLVNRRVLSAGEGIVGTAQSIKNTLIIGENTGGSARFSSTCGFYLPHSKIIANLPRQFILIPGLEECVGYLPDYWLDTHEPVREVLKWLADPENYQFKYANSYDELTNKINLSPVLPANLKILAPGSGVPAMLAVFSGKWYGVWDGVLDNILVVEKINADLTVNAIYAWGVAYQWNINQAGWQRFKGKFKERELILTNENNTIKITCRLGSDSTMLATYERPGIFSRARLTRENECLISR